MNKDNPRRSGESINRQNFGDRVEAVVAKFEEKKPYTFHYEDLKIPNTCVFTLQETPTSLGTEVRVRIAVEAKGKQATGFVYVTIPRDRTEVSALMLNKGWRMQSALVEGSGLMKRATVALMAYVYEKYGIQKYGGIMGSIVSDRQVMRSRPNGTFGAFTFETKRPTGDHFLFTEVKKTKDNEK